MVMLLLQHLKIILVRYGGDTNGIPHIFKCKLNQAIKKNVRENLKIILRLKVKAICEFQLMCILKINKGNVI